MSQADKLRKEILEKTKEYYQAKFGGPQSFEAGKSRVQYAGRVFDENELYNLIDSSLDFWLTAGRYHEEFAYKLAGFYGIANVLPVNSGSSANLLAISALTSYKLKDKSLKPGDEVITVAAGFPTTVAPIIQNNLIPVFVDVELGTYNALVEQIEEAISARTKAICMAHTLGNPFNLGKITELAEKHGIWLIEDNCDALGSRYNGKLTGTFGHIATGSFYPAHHITTGEGGCVITGDDDLAKIIRSFRDWGRDCYCEGGENNTCGRRFSQQFGTLPLGYDHKYVYTHIGYNLKMTDMQAAIGVAQLDKLENFTSARKHNHALLSKGLKPFEDYLILHQATENSDPSWFAYVITVKENQKFTRNQLTAYLESRQIETRNLFSGNLLLHPAFQHIEKRVIGTLQNANTITKNTFFIGVYPGLTQEKINYVIETFNAFLQNNAVKDQSTSYFKKGVCQPCCLAATKTRKTFFNFKAGQFLHLAMEQYDPSMLWPASRVFSIASAPGNKSCIEIVVSAKGNFTTKMVEELKEQDTVWIKLPYGDFTFDAPANKVVLIAGGTGISPFLSYLDHTLATGGNPNIYLYYGVRQPDLIIFNDKLNAYKNMLKELQIFSEIPGETLVRDTKITHGKIDISAIYQTHKHKNTTYYLSGPIQMTHAFKTYLLHNGINNTLVKIDNWD
ncbi:MAG: lipopolysaccharide biosynthesis protein RfbH [Bacteroidales bacterium]|nr:lipopolysaccharide biosynthesis protein RfbH [Bacteroidales bacterium]